MKCNVTLKFQALSAGADQCGSGMDIAKDVFLKKKILPRSVR